MAEEIIKLVKSLTASSTHKSVIWSIHEGANLIGVEWRHQVRITGSLFRTEMLEDINRFESYYKKSGSRVEKKMLSLGVSNMNGVMSGGETSIKPSKDQILFSHGINFNYLDESLEIIIDYLERVIKAKKT